MSRASGVRAAAGVAALLAAAGAVDAWTGSQASASLGYLAAVGWSAWRLGPAAGVATAVASALTFALVDRLSAGPARPAGILAWNVLVELVTYSVVAGLLAALHQRMREGRAIADHLREARDALAREAEAVGRLQRLMLPASLPHLPGYALAVRYQTSSRAGGDAYDFLPLADGRCGILVTDATGHGPAAAMLMAMCRGLARRILPAAAGPGEGLAALSRALAGDLPAGWFVTACYAVLDREQGRVDYALAGHEPPLRTCANGTAGRLPVCGGTVLGLEAGVAFAEGRTTLEPGDGLLLHTDGLTEARDARGLMFGDADIVRALVRIPAADPEARLAALDAALALHRAGEPPADDTTLVLLVRTGHR